MPSKPKVNEFSIPEKVALPLSPVALLVTDLCESIGARDVSPNIAWLDAGFFNYPSAPVDYKVSRTLVVLLP